MRGIYRGRDQDGRARYVEERQDPEEARKPAGIVHDRTLTPRTIRRAAEKAQHGQGRKRAKARARVKRQIRRDLGL